MRTFPQLRRFNHDEAKFLYEGGINIPELSKKYGVATSSVYFALKRQGVTFRRSSESISLGKRGKKRVDSGYITVAAGMNIRKKEHVLIAEKVLGRPLKRNEMVHHINCIKTDNRRKNLLICTRSYHTALHHRMRKNDYWKKIEIKGREK